MSYVDTANEHKLASDGEREHTTRLGKTYHQFVCICGFRTMWLRNKWVVSLLFEKHVIRETQLKLTHEQVEDRVAAIKAQSNSEVPF